MGSGCTDVGRPEVTANPDPERALYARHRNFVAHLLITLTGGSRSREIMSWGLTELVQAVEREEARLGVKHDDPDLSESDAAALQAAWERAAMARAESENDYPYVHAVTLVSMYGALDALVEELVPGAQQIIAMSFFETLQEKLSDEDRALWDDVTEERRELLRQAITNAVADMLPQKPAKPRGGGAGRYEAVLERAGLRTTAARPIPPDLDETLAELGALRDVLVHRAGRVDAKALADAPTLPYHDGDFVRIDRANYRRYSAAVRAYGIDIAQRIVPPLTRDDLANWRSNHSINA